MLLFQPPAPPSPLTLVNEIQSQMGQACSLSLSLFLPRSLWSRCTHYCNFYLSAWVLHQQLNPQIIIQSGVCGPVNIVVWIQEYNKICALSSMWACAEECFWVCEDTVNGSICEFVVCHCSLQGKDCDTGASYKWNNTWICVVTYQELIQTVLSVKYGASEVQSTATLDKDNNTKTITQI